MRENADEAGREDLALWAGVHIICKDTEKEAQDYVEVHRRGEGRLGERRPVPANRRIAVTPAA